MRRNAVLISIRPKWVKKIASGEKTVEVRKTRPKLKVPFKCYIYCTLMGAKELAHSFGNSMQEQIIGWNKGKWGLRKGKVVGEFNCDRIDEYPYRSEFGYEISEEDFNATMLTADEFCGYGNQETLYGWHISDLKIYDKPRKLSEFKRTCPIKNQFAENCNVCPYSYYERNQVVPSCSAYLKRPPQSWCYVEGVEE